MITLIELEELDSTSSHAQRLLDAGQARPPFAVRADRQTGGRGRRGARWESPAGNLYLTVVLPAGGRPEQTGLAPLKAALLTAEYVLQTTGVRLTLKWPNDLLFAGRKVCGFLLEGSLRGDEAGPVAIGIGLNLAHAPPLPAPARAASLAAITGRAFDPSAFAAGLARHLVDGFGARGAEATLAALDEFALPAGSVWQDGSAPRTLRRLAGIDPDGALRLLPLAADDPLERLTSIDHTLHWIYQGGHALGHPLVVADVGNTSTKVAFFSPAGAEKAAPAPAFADGDEAGLRAALARFAGAVAGPGWPVHALSVSPRRLARLTELAEEAGLRVLPLAKRPVRRRGAAYPLAALGIDRLALIEAWLADHPREAALIVSAGTATTVDLVRGDGTHEGGLILAGLQTSLDALHHATGLLPALAARAARPADALGHGTEGAMLNGALIAALGAVEHVARAAGGARIVLTGGFAPLLAPHLAHALLAPDLALRGAQVLALGGVLPEDR